MKKLRIAVALPLLAALGGGCALDDGLDPAEESVASADVAELGSRCYLIEQLELGMCEQVYRFNLEVCNTPACNGTWLVLLAMCNATAHEKYDACIGAETTEVVDTAVVTTTTPTPTSPTGTDL